MSIKTRDKKTNSPQVHQLELLTSEVEELRRQINRKLQQLEELLKILEGQSIIQSEELTTEVERQIIELQNVAKLSPPKKIPDLKKAKTYMQKTLDTAEEEHRKILITMLISLRKKLEESQKYHRGLENVANLLMREVDGLEKENIDSGKLQEHVEGLLRLASSILEERLVMPREPVEIDKEKKLLAIKVGEHLETIPLSPDPFSALEGVLEFNESFKKLRRQAEHLAQKEAAKRVSKDAPP
jgi:hypothetical protein